MSRQRRWMSVVLASTAALTTCAAVGCSPAAPSLAAAPAVAAPAEAGPGTADQAATRPADGSPRRVLAETPTKDIRPDAPLTGTSPTNLAGVVPVRLQVPGIGVDTGLVGLGLRADGAIAVPTTAAVAGWYTGGPAPGQVGPAVVAGHVDSRTGPGVFYRLRDLRIGDPVVVHRADGRAERFAVTTVERFTKAAFPTARVYGPTPFAELRLVTCGGSFDAATRHYRDNVVVFASRLG